MLLRFVFLLLPAALLAQTAPPSVTVTASRSASVQPDQINFSVNVSTSASATADTVTAALRAAGLSATFGNVRSVQQLVRNQPQLSLEWTFNVTDALSNMKAALDALVAAQRKVAALNNGFAMTFYVSGPSVSAKAQEAAGCSLPDLIADARAQAQKLAAAAATGLGPILAMSGTTIGPDPAFSSFLSPSTPVCSMTVKFGLGL